MIKDLNYEKLDSLNFSEKAEVREDVFTKRIYQILESREQKKPEEFEIKSHIPIEEERLNWHNDFLKLIEEKIKNKNVLDLFCGANSVKRYFKENNFSGEVIGIDSQTKAADIKGDVAELYKLLPEKKKFDFICSFGNEPGIMKIEDIENHLEDDGFFISSASEIIYDEYIVPVIKREKVELDKKDRLGKDLVKEIEEILKKFFPQVIIKVKEQKLVSKSGVKDMGADVYVIYRKISEIGNDL